MNGSNACRMIFLPVIAMLLVLASVPGFAVAQDMLPPARVDLSIKSVAAGVGVSWGQGVLRYEGKEFPIKINGLSVGSVGIQNATGWGEVYNLRNPEDIAGNYTAVDVGATIGAGGTILKMRNDLGVVIDLHATTQGLNFALAAAGVKISLG